MSKSKIAVAVLAVALAACGGGAAGTTQAPATTMAGMSGTTMDMGHDHGDEATREWDGTGVPTVSLTVTGDNTAGWTGTVEVTNFVIDPADAMDPVPGHGHVHVMVDGSLWNMVFAPTFTIPHLDPGPHQISVSLGSNDHMDYVLDGEPIGASTTVDVPGDVQAADLTIDIQFAGGEATVTPTDPAVTHGGLVEVNVTSDVDEEVHIHGYDLMLDVAAGETATVRFTADVIGKFEVELEKSATPLFELTVS